MLGRCDRDLRSLAGPRHRYFKVRVGDGGVYILRHDTARDQWELTLFDSGRRDETRLSST
jgi:hypothetical protein